MTTFKIEKAMERAFYAGLRSYGSDLIGELAMEYGFSLEEAQDKYSFRSALVVTSRREKKEPRAKVSKPSMPMPWCGSADLDGGMCHGLRLNHGLYTQCRNDHEGEKELCKTCARSAHVSGRDGPAYGTIEDRVSNGADFRDPSGKAPVPYGNVLKKLNISRECAAKEADKFGITLSDADFVVTEGKRGRPKKTTVSDSDSDSTAEKRTRGRPKKERPVQSTGDNLIAALAQCVQDAPNTEASSNTKERSSAQLAAFEAAKAKRAANVASKNDEIGVPDSSDDDAAPITGGLKVQVVFPDEVDEAQAKAVAKAEKKEKKKKAKSDDEAEAQAKAVAKAEKKEKKEKKNKAKSDDEAVAKAETPKAETPKAETPKAETPKAETPKEWFSGYPGTTSPSPPVEVANAEEPSVKCTIVCYNDTNYAITADNDAFFGDGTKKGEYYGNYNPATGVVTEEVFDSEEESE